jgi:hypothetical protein
VARLGKQGFQDKCRFQARAWEREEGRNLED